MFLALLAGAALVPASAAHARQAPPDGWRQLAQATVPGSAVSSAPVLLGGTLNAGTYWLVVTGEVDIAPKPPENSTVIDGVYCVRAGYCTVGQPKPLLIVQRYGTSGQSSDYYETFGQSNVNGAYRYLPADPDHVYAQAITMKPSLHLGMWIGDTVPEDNAGSYTVTLFGPPPPVLTPVSSDPAVAPVGPTATASTGGTTATLPKTVGIGKGIAFFPIRVFSARPPRGIVATLIQGGRIVSMFRIRLTTRRALLKVPLRKLRAGPAIVTYRVFRSVPGRDPVGRFIRQRFVAVKIPPRFSASRGR
jgi:hypothetical protein